MSAASRKVVQLSADEFIDLKRLSIVFVVVVVRETVNPTKKKQTSE